MDEVYSLRGRRRMRDGGVKKVLCHFFLGWPLLHPLRRLVIAPLLLLISWTYTGSRRTACRIGWTIQRNGNEWICYMKCFFSAAVTTTLLLTWIKGIHPYSLLLDKPSSLLLLDKVILVNMPVSGYALWEIMHHRIIDVSTSSPFQYLSMKQQEIAGEYRAV